MNGSDIVTALTFFMLMFTLVRWTNKQPTKHHQFTSGVLFAEKIYNTENASQINSILWNLQNGDECQDFNGGVLSFYQVVRKTDPVIDAMFHDDLADIKGCT